MLHWHKQYMNYILNNLGSKADNYNSLCHLNIVLRCRIGIRGNLQESKLSKLDDIISMGGLCLLCLYRSLHSKMCNFCNYKDHTYCNQGLYDHKIDSFHCRQLQNYLCYYIYNTNFYYTHIAYIAHLHKMNINVMN